MLIVAYVKKNPKSTVKKELSKEKKYQASTSIAFGQKFRKQAVTSFRKLKVFFI